MILIGEVRRFGENWVRENESEHWLLIGSPEVNLKNPAVIGELQPH